MILYSGIVAAWFGEKDLAIENISKAAQLPGFVTYGALKLLPWYDPLRGDPRFERIVQIASSKMNCFSQTAPEPWRRRVASLAPKEP
jgi:hypothetical protein